jgi:hypothetical protein
MLTLTQVLCTTIKTSHVKALNLADTNRHTYADIATQTSLCQTHHTV